MDDAELTELHDKLSSANAARGVRGGLGKGDTLRIKGGAKKASADPKQPFIKFVKAAASGQRPLSSKSTSLEEDDEVVLVEEKASHSKRARSSTPPTSSPLEIREVELRDSAKLNLDIILDLGFSYVVSAHGEIRKCVLLDNQRTGKIDIARARILSLCMLDSEDSDDDEGASELYVVLLDLKTDSIRQGVLLKSRAAGPAGVRLFLARKAGE